MVNTATIQWIHSTTNYHEAKVMTSKKKKKKKKTEDTCTFCFRNTPTGKAGQTFAPFTQPLRRNQPCHRLHSTITKVNTCTRTYRYYYLRKYPNRENKENVCQVCQPPINLGFHFPSTWLDNNEIIHVSIYFQAHPALALQLATTYQCCIQAQSLPNMSNKCLWYRWTTPQYERSTIISFQHQCLTNTNSASQQMCGAWNYSNLLQIATRISDQQI